MPEDASGQLEVEETLERTTSEEITTVQKPVLERGPFERSRRRLETAVVKGHSFSFLPALEGKWSGPASTLDGQEVACSIKVVYREAEGLWEVRTTTADSSGMADVRTFHLEPVGHGRCRVVLDESTAATYEEQCGDLFATITHRCKLTGGLERMEVWALQTASADEQRLTRTSTAYQEGDLVSMVVARERKVG